MPGIKPLRKIQLGQEVTKGAAVAATTIWRGTGVIKDDRAIVRPDEDIGLLVAGERIYVPRLGATLAMDEVEATFEQLPYLLAAGIEKVVSGATDLGGSGKVYEFNQASTTAHDLQTFTVEQGDDQRVDEVEYAYVEKFTLSGSKGEAVMMAADWRGRQVSDAEFTDPVGVPVVEVILFGMGRLYIDATTIGTTQKTATWLGFSLDVPGGWKAVYTGDGELYFTQVVYKGHKNEPITGEITLEHDGAAEAEITAARAGTLRALRMTFDGNALTTAGEEYTAKTLLIDAVVKYTDVPELGDEDADDIVTLPFEVVYCRTATPEGKFLAADDDVILAYTGDPDDVVYATTEALGCRFVVVNENASLT